LEEGGLKYGSRTEMYRRPSDFQEHQKLDWKRHKRLCNYFFVRKSDGDEFRKETFESGDIVFHVDNISNKSYKQLFRIRIRPDH
jgi:hypothetical protein